MITKVGPARDEKVSILIVDDLPANLLALQVVLSDPKYHVITASSGQEALEKMNEHDFAAILLDVMMPIMDGFEVATRVRGLASSRYTPIIFVTSLATEEIRRKAYSVGGVDYLQKPLDPDIVRSKVAAFAELYRKSEQHKHEVEQRRQSEVRFHTVIAKAHEELAAAVEELKGEIRERERVESELRQSEQRFKQLAETIRQVFWMFDTATHQLLYVSPACEEVYGRSRDELRHNPLSLLDIIHPDDRAQVEYTMQRQLNGDITSQEFRLVHPNDGKIRWLWVQAFPVKREDGQVYCIAGISEDITERKRNEEILAEREQHLRLITDALPVLVSYVDQTHRYVSSNRAYEKWFGIEGIDIAGKHVSEVIGEEAYEAVRPQLDAALTGKNISFDSEAPYKSGGIRYVHVDYIPDFDESGSVRGVITLVNDISDRRRVEIAQQRAKEVAEAASRSKSVFLANMSHEIRTPLNAIVGFADVLKDPLLGEAERHQFLDAIARNGRQLTQLIDDILDLSKVEAGKLSIERLNVSLPHLLTEVTSLLILRAKERGVSLFVRFEGPIPESIESDPTRLRQVLVNIIGNAVKFTREGKINVIVKLTDQDKEPGKHRIAFVVTDTGPGIPFEHQNLLFQPFTQADNTMTRKFGGTGLGLVLSRRLARCLGGDVELTESAPGKGSTFTVTVGAGRIGEFADLNNSPGEKRISLAPAIGRPKRLKGIRVLVAEDSPDNQLLIKSILAAEGAEVEVVGDGAEAVEKALRQDFNVVLMDIQMPVLDGYHATEQLRNQGYQRPIVALTAHAMKDERDRCLRAGCNDHLTKPINHGSLVSTVEQFAGQRH